MALNMDWLKHTTMVEDDLLPTLWKQLIEELTGQDVVEIVSEKFTLPASEFINNNRAEADNFIKAAGDVIWQNTLHKINDTVIDSDTLVTIKYTADTANMLNTLPATGVDLTINPTIMYYTKGHRISYWGDVSRNPLQETGQFFLQNPAIITSSKFTNIVNIAGPRTKIAMASASNVTPNFMVIILPHARILGTNAQTYSVEPKEEAEPNDISAN